MKIFFLSLLSGFLNSIILFGLSYSSHVCPCDKSWVRVKIITERWSNNPDMRKWIAQRKAGSNVASSTTNLIRIYLLSETIFRGKCSASTLPAKVFRRHKLIHFIYKYCDVTSERKRRNSFRNTSQWMYMTVIRVVYCEIYVEIYNMAKRSIYSVKYGRTYCTLTNVLVRNNNKNIKI